MQERKGKREREKVGKGENEKTRRQVFSPSGAAGVYCLNRGLNTKSNPLNPPYQVEDSRNGGDLGDAPEGLYGLKGNPLNPPYQGDLGTARPMEFFRPGRANA